MLLPFCAAKITESLCLQRRPAEEFSKRNEQGPVNRETGGQGPMRNEEGGMRKEE